VDGVDRMKRGGHTPPNLSKLGYSYRISSLVYSLQSVILNDGEI
jgi:hypothetical protein